MYKRGFSAHIDWVIGIGLFLVYLALVFVIFKPGVTPVFDSETLLDIVETNVMGYAVNSEGDYVNEASVQGRLMWRIVKTPVFVRSIRFCDPVGLVSVDPVSNAERFVILEGFDERVSDDITLGGFEKNEFFYVPTKDEGEQIIGGGHSVERTHRDGGRARGFEGNDDTRESNVHARRGNRGGDDQEFSAQAGDDQEEEVEIASVRPNSMAFSNIDAPKFFVRFGEADYVSETITINWLNSNLKINEDDESPPEVENVEIIEACYFSNEVNPIDESYDPCGDHGKGDCEAMYSFGSSEIVEGLFLEDGLSETLTGSYNAIKEKWDFPQSKEFQIVVYSYRTDLYIEWLKFPNFALPKGANIYSRQFNSFILNKDGLREPVIVNLMVW